MPLSGRHLGAIGRLAAAVLALWAGMASAGAAEGDLLHSTADKQLWHRKEDVIELIGHAVVSQPGETISADFITLDRKTRMLTARGNCVYVTSGNVIYGDEMHFNLETRTGTIIGGRVSNDRFSLSGERINKLGDGRFQTHWGEYSTCVDCPNSWSLMAEDVDMQVEGYAFMKNVTSKIRDTPAFWLPYLIVPMKSRRQTGVLFPSFALGSLNGVQFVLPFFWAINRSADMTFGVGAYSARGPRLQWEGRYALSGLSGGQANVYYLRDSTFVDAGGKTPLPPSRYAFDVTQVQELPFGLIQKLRYTDVSDNQYPLKIGDVQGSGELNMASSASIAYAGDDVSGYVAFRRYRTLINTLPDPALAITQFDPRTVQQYPVAQLSFNDRLLFGKPLVFGLTMGIANFTRSRDAFDYDAHPGRGVPGDADYIPEGGVPFGTEDDSPPSYRPGVDPIRKATRVSVTPSLYTTLRPFDLFSVTPSMKYYYYWYTFPATIAPNQPNNFEVDNLNRGYLQLQLDFAAQLERVYEYPDDKNSPRTKHLIRPMMTYSYIPEQPFSREDTDHPFLEQIEHASRQGYSGYFFDNYDIIPRDTTPAGANFFIPLGNSLNVGVTTQWIRRNGAIDSPAPSYTKFIEASVGQAFNFREYQLTEQERGGRPAQPRSRFFNTLDLNLGRFAYSHTYYYYPYPNAGFSPHTISTSVSYALERGIHQGLYNFDRSVGVTYAYDRRSTQGYTSNLRVSTAYSISDYFLPSAYVSFSAVDHKFQNGGGSIQFQSPSRCWKLTFNANYDINQRKPESEPGGTSPFNGFNFNFDLALNITGTGFGGVTDIANQATSSK